MNSLPVDVLPPASVLNRLHEEKRVTIPKNAQLSVVSTVLEYYKKKGPVYSADLEKKLVQRRGNFM